MKKKWIVVGSAVGISSIVMLSTGFSAMASSSGYDAYKSAFKNTKTVKSVAVQASANLQDNGSVLTDAKGSFKVSLDQKAMSGSTEVTSNGNSQAMNVYRQSNQMVLKPAAGDVYYVKQDGRDRKYKQNDAAEKEVPQQVETVIDALVGNLKDYVVVNEKTDGSKEISVQLDNTQLPAVVNAIAPIAIKHAGQEHHVNMNKDDAAGLPFQKDSLKPALPKLTQDIKIDKVAIKANVDSSNYINHQEADVTVTGKDDSGAAHQVTLHLQADLSGYNSTTPDTIDLTGKTVQQVKQALKGEE